MPVNHHGGSAGPPRGHRAGGHRDVPARGHLVVAQRAHQPDRRRRARTSPRAAVRLHRAGHRVGARLPRIQLDYFFDRMRNAVGSQEREWGLPVVEKMALQRRASTGPASATSVRASSGRPRCRSASRSASTGSCGGATTRTRSRATRSRRRRSGSASPSVDPDEVQRMLGGNAAALYGFDLDALRAASRARIGPAVGEVARPLSPADFPEGSQKCPAFADSAARHALTTYSSRSLRGEPHVGRHPQLAWTVRSTRSIRAACFGEVLARRRSNVSRTCSPTAVRVFAPAPLVVEVDGDAWTLAVDGGTRARARRWRRRRTGAVLRTNPAQLDDLVNDQVTVVGMQTNGTLDQPVGRFDALLDWWLLLRGALDARAPPRPGRHRRSSTPAARRSRSTAASRPMLPSTRWATSSNAPGTSTSRACTTEDEMAAVSLDMDRAAPDVHARATDARGGRGTVTATSCWCACSTSTRCRPRSSGWCTTSACCGLADLTGDGHVRQHERQPHRGLVQAVRRRRGDLRPAVAQGLRARAATATTAAA